MAERHHEQAASAEQEFDRPRWELLYAISLLTEYGRQTVISREVADELLQQDDEQLLSLLQAATSDGQLAVVGCDPAGNPLYRLTREGKRAIADGANHPTAFM